MAQETYNIREQLIADGRSYVNWTAGKNFSAGLSYKYQHATFTNASIGDRDDGIIGGAPHVYVVDNGRYVVFCDFGEGLTVYRVENGGSFTRVYRGNDHSIHTSFAVNEARKTVFVARYNGNGLYKYDFSANGWEGTPTYTSITTSNSTLASNQIGDYGDNYYNAMALAGDWLYFNPSDYTEVGKVTRWNFVTNVKETLTFQNNTSRQIRRGSLNYDSTTDTIFMTPYDGSAYVIVTNASNNLTDTPAPRACDQNISNTSAVFTRTRGAYMWPDPTNLNHLIALDNYRKPIRFDWGHIRTGSATELTGDDVIDFGGYSVYDDWYDIGQDRPYVWCDPDGRVWYNGYGSQGTRYPLELDKNNLFRPMNIHQYFSMYVYDYDKNINEKDSSYFSERRSGADYETDYGFSWHEITSPDGSTYYVTFGYTDLDSYITEEKPWDYMPSGSVYWGNFTMSDGGNIEGITLWDTGSWLYTPTGTSAALEVSNNNGSTYETYSENSDGYHEFSSTGNSARIRLHLTASVDGQVAPYVFSSHAFNYTLHGSDTIPEDVVRFANINIKR